jgi:hypothetical protein
MDETTPFEFSQSVSIHKSTGKKAGNLRELRDVIAETSKKSIGHHNNGEEQPED